MCSLRLRCRARAQLGLCTYSFALLKLETLVAGMDMTRPFQVQPGMCMMQVSSIKYGERVVTIERDLRVD
jgi:hypothetical protein